MKESPLFIQSILYPTYAVGFLFFLHSYLPAYVNSSFLSGLLGERGVGLIFTVAFILSAIALVFAPLVLKRIGNYKFVLILLLTQILVFWGLSTLKETALLLPLFIISQIGLILLSYSFDIFVERESTNERTGGIRGVFLTIGNFALVLSPFAAGLVVGHANNYQRLFAVAGILLLPAVFLAVFRFKGFSDPDYKIPQTGKAIRSVWGNKNLRNVFSAQVVLRIFYAFMAIYLPIYMHEHIGFSWPEIGVMFTIMVLPFALFELPLGFLADKKYGEKEIMTLGFIIAGISTASLSINFGPSIALWTLVLFITRVGISMVEIMTETYFFKKVEPEDSEIISLFRILGPVSYASVPIFVIIFFTFMDLRFMFILLGLLSIYATKYSLALIDTK